jgi:AcrR family transcriptional regulator
MNLRDRHRLDTHVAIRRAAQDLALERGVAHITVQEISDSAGISPRTFFNHFKTKEDALLPELPDFPEEAAAAFLSKAEPNLVSALEDLVVATFSVDQESLPAANAEFLDRSMRLVAENPELLPRMLLIFEGFDRDLADLIAQRTQRDPHDVFCLVGAGVALAATRAGLRRSLNPAIEAWSFDPDAVHTAFEALKALID